MYLSASGPFKVPYNQLFASVIWVLLSHRVVLSIVVSKHACFEYCCLTGFYRHTRRHFFVLFFVSIYAWMGLFGNDIHMCAQCRAPSNQGPIHFIRIYIYIYIFAYMNVPFWEWHTYIHIYIHTRVQCRAPSKQGPTDFWCQDSCMPPVCPRHARAASGTYCICVYACMNVTAYVCMHVWM